MPSARGTGALVADQKARKLSVTLLRGDPFRPEGLFDAVKIVTDKCADTWIQLSPKALTAARPMAAVCLRGGHY